MATINLEMPYQFEPRWYQAKLFNAIATGRKKRAIGIWHRRAGKDKTLINLMACMMAKRVGSYYYFLPTYSQGRKIIWEGMDRDGFPFLEHIPPQLVAAKNNTEMRLILHNGSIFRVVGSDNIDTIVGTNPVGCVFSEYSLQDPRGWDFIRPILVENGGWAAFNFTPRGRNHGWDLWNGVKDSKDWHAEILTVTDTGVVSPEDINAERMAGMSEDLIRQEFYCLPSGTLIHTSTGQRPIESISEGEFVLSHKGRFRKVLKTHSREFFGQLKQIWTYGNNFPLTLTDNHSVRVVDPETQTYSWIPAGEIKEDMWLAMPRRKIGRSNIDEKLARLIAWYICEGSVAKTAVQFTLSKDEIDYVSELQMLLDWYGCKHSLTNGESVTNVIAHSVDLADFMATYCGSGASNKRIPWEIISGHEQIVYETLINGDGCRYIGKREKFHSYVTVSSHLAYDVQLLASTLGYRAGIHLKRHTSNVVLGRECNCKPKYNIQIRHVPLTENGTKWSKIRPAKHAVAVRVKQVNDINIDGTIHNLSVQFDNSYVAFGRVVHNCDFEAALPGAYFSEQLRQAREEGRICRVPHQAGVSVDTYWDLGMDDATSIWFAQNVGREVRLINYYESSGEGLAHYAAKLNELKEQYRYVYGTHYAPHDIEVRELGTGKSRKETAYELGIDFTTVKRMTQKAEGIEAARNIISSCWFDEDNCRYGIDALASYTKEYDESNRVFKTKPVHNWASHAADAFQTLAMGHSFNRIDQATLEKIRYKKRKSWMAA